MEGGSVRIFYKQSSLTYSLLASLLLVSIEVEPWALTICIILLAFRFGSEKNWWRPIPSILVNLLSVIGLILVYLQFKTFLGQEASSTLLVILVSLRIADFRSIRDERFLVLLGFILVALKFLFTVDLYWFPVGGAIFLGLWRSLLPTDMEKPWRTTFTASLKSLPVVVILFFVFPRVQVPWASYYKGQIPLSGMSESLSPGDIADLTLSQETAFRAEFLSLRPVMKDLYWRGAVLENGDGFKWKKATGAIKEIETGSSETIADYIVLLEPSSLRILPVLEHTRMVTASGLKAMKTDRATFKTNEPISARIKYLAQSTVSWSGPTVENPIEIPQNLPPKTQAWALNVLKSKPNYFEKIQTLKKFFLDSGFSYTRSPGAYTNLDEFLFDRKLGFCEHFAGAYATLARALGIPARVVTGYQGGEWNEAGSFLRVSQADAHAWVEVRNIEGRWIRVDPTLWIAPLRIELGGVSFFRLSPAELRLTSQDALNRLKNAPWFLRTWETVESQIDNLNYRWTRTMLGFDITEQQKILQLIAPKIGWWIAALFGLALVVVLIRRMTLKSPFIQDQAVISYLWLEEKLNDLGFYRESFEAPVLFLEKIKSKRPDDSVLIDKTIQLYRYERYRERKSGPDDWSRLKREWKKRLAETSKQSS